MNERRRGGFSRHSESKIYYPSGRGQFPRRSRFRRHASENSTAAPNGVRKTEKRSLLKLFRPHDDSGRKLGRGKEKRFRPRHRTAEPVPSPPAAPPARVQREPSPPPAGYYPPVYPYYPAPPVYPPPPPPPYPYSGFDEYGRPLTRRELEELNAREDYEDRYGRDFDHYADGTAPAAPGNAELLPRNYLADTEDGQ